MPKEKQKIKAVPKPKPEIGIDTTNSFPENLLDGALNATIDSSILENFSNVSQTREQIYSLIDTMAQDTTLAAVIESYAEDATEYNDYGKIVWAEGGDEKVNKYINYLLDSLNVDKHIYSWAHSLVKYGDIYLRLYRESDYGEDYLFGDSKGKSDVLTESLDEDKKDKEKLKEDVNVIVNSKNDHYVHYVEAVPNPGEMYDLIKFGRTVGYIQAPTAVIHQDVQNTNPNNYFNNFLKMNKKDVNVFGATDFVHGCLEDLSSRSPEEVNIFIDNDLEDDKVKKHKVASYKVKRGQSLLYNQFKIWRELSLLENSVLLSRLTRSSVNRVLQVEVGDMPKNKVRAHIAQLKALFEQKAALNKNQSYQEYTNPGAMENYILIPTHEGKGHIENFTMGGDVDPKQLTDLSWFQDKLFGGLRVPKQFFGVTDDNAGFSGGESLSIISSKYGKAVKRIQNTLIQMITDLINLFLIDKGITGYINKFTIRIQPPVTKDEQERRQNNDVRLRYVSDVMNNFNDVDDVLFKLKLNKQLLAPIINDDEVLALLQEKIDEMEAEEEPKEETSKETITDEDENSDSEMGIEEEPAPLPEFNPEFSSEEETSEEEVIEPVSEEGEESYLPNPEELGVDMTQNL